MRSPRTSKLQADRLQNAGPGEDVDVWLFSSFPKDNWVARKRGDLTHADHPGTAVRIGDDIFEILTAEETAEPGFAIRYGLKKWDPQHALRLVIPYTPETQSRSTADFLEEKGKQDLRARILWLLPFAGQAPDPLQREWEMKTALNMTLISAVSAVMTLFLFMTLVQIFGRSPANKLLSYFIYYLGFESFVRLLWIVFSGKPHGNLLLTLPYILWAGITRPEKRVREAEGPRPIFEGDEVIRRPGTSRLEIRSMLFDDVLTGPAPVLFEGAVYRPIRWHEQGKGLSRRWVYELEKMDADPKGRYREYTQPRTLARQKIVEDFTDKRDRAHIFALLWGTFPRKEQARLEILYDFPAARWTAITAGILLVVSLLQIWGSILLHTTIVAIVPPVYLILESLYRLYQSKAYRRPAGSVYGYILRLFLHPPE